MTIGQWLEWWSVSQFDGNIDRLYVCVVTSVLVSERRGGGG